MASRDLAELLGRLARGEVACILVGGMAGVMRGAPVVTSDIDVVHLRRKNNVERLLRVLSDLDAVYRQDERRLRPSESHLMGPGHQLLTTRLGPIDLLGSLDGEDYEQLEASSSPMVLGGLVQDQDRTSIASARGGKITRFPLSKIGEPAQRSNSTPTVIPTSPCLDGEAKSRTSHKWSAPETTLLRTPAPIVLGATRPILLCVD